MVVVVVVARRKVVDPGETQRFFCADSAPLDNLINMKSPGFCTNCTVN